MVCMIWCVLKGRLKVNRGIADDLIISELVYLHLVTTCALL